MRQAKGDPRIRGETGFLIGSGTPISRWETRFLEGLALGGGLPASVGDRGQLAGENLGGAYGCGGQNGFHEPNAVGSGTGVADENVALAIAGEVGNGSDFLVELDEQP